MYKTRGLQKRGSIIPELDEVFVSPRVTPVEPRNAKIYPIPLKSIETDGVNIWKYLAGATDKSSGYNPMLILGAPGSGKTTLLEELALVYAQNKQNEKYSNAPKLIPILLSLTEVSGIIREKGHLNLSELITEKLRRSTSMNIQDKWFEDKLISGQCLVMLDGLDEVQEDPLQILAQFSGGNPFYLSQIVEWIDEQMVKYSKSVFIITSRPFVYKTIQLKKVRLSLKIQPFDLLQVKEFISKWYLKNEAARRGKVKVDKSIKQAVKEKSNDLVSRIKGFSALTYMAFNPLLLTMIAILHSEGDALPGSRVSLYDEICDVLLGRRDAAKRLPNNRNQVNIALNKNQKKFVLQSLAFNLTKKGKTDFLVEDVNDIIQDILNSVSGQSIKTREFLDNVANYIGLIIEIDKGFYRFAHLSFQEYLTALHIKEINQEEILIENISNPKWKEVIRLYVAKSNADEIIRTAMKTATKKRNIRDDNAIDLLVLAFDCLNECNSVSRKIRIRMDSWLEEGLNSSNMQIRDVAQKISLNRMLYGSNNSVI